MTVYPSSTRVRMQWAAASEHIIIIDAVNNPPAMIHAGLNGSLSPITITVTNKQNTVTIDTTVPYNVIS